MARITIDARKYFDFGIGTYIRSLVMHLARIHTEHSFRLLISPEDEKRISPPEGWDIQVVPYGKYSVSEFLLMRRVLESGPGALFHSPHYTLPLGVPCRSIVTIHDLIHLKLPQFFSLPQRAYAYGMIRHAVGRADLIMTNSETTKRDIVKSFSVPEENVVVARLGVSELFRKHASPASLRGFRKRHGLQRPFILFAGNPKAHKGVDILVEAYRRIHDVSSGVELVLMGGRIETASLGWAEGHVRSLGYLSEEDVRLAYRCAEMLVLPSLYEGFGLPAIEAMASGTPVVVSDAGALPEIVGDAALVVQTRNSRVLANEIIYLMRHPGLKRRLVKKGRERSLAFRWEITARKTLDAYNSVLQRDRTLPPGRR